jgi:hypothetical protein
MSHSLTEPAIFGNEPQPKQYSPKFSQVATEVADAKPAAIQ